ncbi:M42 family metallopeptidase [Pseudalkalibacillus salsuginis]|uniref:M42 family metallopeptidase n=1 Tax=Pseudalkalibacillus salsuginis TaxID=2910972 RepID=UPI001F2F726B|nr:M42 family metallopeptidase [Pseudalkalibacillus salsuginis]MCF6408723.1 M42 family metallopeptidase [Pseudalkalibacillus salsuginis]
MNNSDETLTMLKELTDANGISGDESEPREVMKKYIKPYADEVFYDNLGSLVAKKKGSKNGPSIMLAGHLDEVGFMVTRIDDKGFLRFQPVGGWWEQVLLAQRVTVKTKKGDVVGIIGSKPPHILSPEARKKPVPIKDMYIDIGASDKENALEIGVRPGDSVIPYFEFTVMSNPKMLLAKAFDNRIGCAIVIDTLRQLKKIKHQNTIYGVGTAQEEVGLRGAKTAAHMIQPDIAFAIDTGIPGDTPGVTERDALSKLGEGPQIIIYDARTISHKGLRDFVIETAEKNKIPYQIDTTPGGGTDAGNIHISHEGVPTISITIATRYLHTNASIIHRDDYEQAVRLMVELIKGLDEKMVRQIKES